MESNSPTQPKRKISYSGRDGTGRSNIASVSWTDHLVFGEGDGRLDSVAALRRRMRKWRRDLGAGVIHWRCARNRIPGKFYSAKGHRHWLQERISKIDWDDFGVVPGLARELGMETHLYVSIFDEGWPLLPKKTRAVSFHNSMHGRHVSFQTEFSRNNPQYTVTDRSRKSRQWGVLCLAHPEVRRHLIERFGGLLDRGSFDGLFVCLRSQSKPADFADQFGFNDPVRNEYLKRYERDILTEDFDLPHFRDLLGEYLTRFLGELRSALQSRSVRLGIGAPRGGVMGPPIGNATLQWAKWIQDGLIDYLVIDQNSLKCPSMWHQLWPMHRGYGYVQNYLDGLNMLPLHEDLDSNYAPAFAKGKARLYVARQWRRPSAVEEAALLAHPTVEGMVFGTFRFDNPGPVSRGDWKA